MTKKEKKRREKLLREKIQKFRLLDDEFMSKVFEDDIDLTQFMLNIVMQRNDLTVLEAKGQVQIKNLLGRSVKLDIKATDKDGKLYNIEVQRDNDGACPERARYHSAILDANTLLPKQNFTELPETYIIFITEHDYFKGGLPFYHIDRTIKENGMTFCDRSHIIYVNGEYQDDSDIGKLMHDFACANPDEMKYRLLAEKTRYYKKDEKGVNKMSPVMEELVAEIAAEERAAEREAVSNEIAMNLLKEVTLSISKIAAAANLTERKVKKLAEKLQVVAR